MDGAQVVAIPVWLASVLAAALVGVGLRCAWAISTDLGKINERLSRLEGRQEERDKGCG
jgi:hypothetical protein